MVRNSVALLLAIVAASLLGSALVMAQEETIVLEHKDVFGSLQRPPVAFSHARHADKYPDCIECHHSYEYKDGKRTNEWSGEGQPCSECHKLEGEGQKLSLMNAFHASCTGCHRKLAQEGKDGNLPATCGECHVRSKKPHRESK